MTRDQFLEALRHGLSGLPGEEADEILADYAAHFDEARAAGRNEEEVAQALGDPSRLARELRAESGLRRFEEERSPGNFMVALVALCGLAAVDLVFLLPLLLLTGVVMLAFGIAFLAIALAGLRVLVSLLPFGGFHPIAALPRLLFGIGLVAGSVGGGSLLLLCASAAVRGLGRYARLHYRLLEPRRRPA